MKILDTTLRDGSYVNNFQITKKQTGDIARALDSAGIHYIEGGHGLGLGACRNPRYRAVAWDGPYMNVLRHNVQNAKCGVFFIPGIGVSDDIKWAADCGMDFIRIGVEKGELESAKKHIELAKSQGLIVFINLMKSYAYSYAELRRTAFDVESLGVDGVYIVDSAGAMDSDKVKEQIQAINTLNIEIGFHGHNNLGMANVNSLTAAKNGATIIDSSLRGMGRSAGNAVTEQMVILAQRRHSPDKGREVEGIDIEALLKGAHKYVDPIIAEARLSRLYEQIGTESLLCGQTYTHSSTMEVVREQGIKDGKTAEQAMIDYARMQMTEETC